MPKVSIIIPNYNHARFLRRRIDTVLGQTLQDFEVILLDDCSTDESRSILSSYATDPRITIEFNEANSGNAFKQWNKGVLLARGEYVWIAESDDYANEHLLDRLAAVLDAEPHVAFAYCRSWRVSADDQLDGFSNSYLADLEPHRWLSDYCADGREECRNYFVLHNIVGNASAVLFRKAVYKRVGGPDEGLRLCGDWKLWASMALIGDIAYLSEPLNYFRFHDASLRSKSTQVNVDVMEYLSVIRWILDQVTPTKTTLTKLYEDASEMWVPVVMSLHVPLHLKRAILRNARAIDPNAMRRAVWPALATVRRKFARHLTLVRNS